MGKRSNVNWGKIFSYLRTNYTTDQRAVIARANQAYRELSPMRGGMERSRLASSVLRSFGIDDPNLTQDHLWAATVCDKRNKYVR